MPDHAVSDSPAVQAQLDRLTMLSPGRDVLGLERITALMSRLGNPHRSLPPVFHVAGTNGKGSTCAFLRAMLEAAGHRVHVYTSPHLVRFNERIRLAGELISDEAFAPLLAEVLDCSGDIAPSFFEATTAAAFLAFSRMPADAAIIEVGLGGRLDATNVIERPAVCGIAALGIDHPEFLLSHDPAVPPMPELARIGFEKAGIAKPGVPLITMSYAPDVSEAVADQAESAEAELYSFGLAWNIKPRSADEMAYVDHRGHRGRTERLVLPRPALAGLHQIDNAGLAVAMLRHQDQLAVPQSALADGVREARWPARLQRLAPGPLSGRRTVWLDGAHNANAGAELYSYFYGPRSEQVPARIHLIAGMLANKDPAAIVKPLQPWLASLTVVPVPRHASHDAKAFGPQAAAAADVAEALAALPDDGLPALIAGSLYLAGRVLEENRQIPD